jgi:lysophospholipase L1-like esterase
MKIVLFGDSITEGFDTYKYLPGFSVINRGVYGENSDDLLKRLNKELQQTQPDIVYILIGTNDFACEFSDARILENISLIIKTCKVHVDAAQIHITSILPTRNIENRPNNKIDLINHIIREACLQEEVIYYDLNALMKDDDGSIKAAYTTDGLHISVEGYKLWSDDLQKRFMLL